MATYSITEEQKQYLATFRCERLRDNDDNQTLIQFFRNNEGSGLVTKLRRAAWNEDKLGSTAYYVVKNAEDEIVLFFSLKCGVLFDPNHVKDHMEIFGGDDYGKVWDAILRPEEAALPALQAIRHQDPANVLLRYETEEDAASMKVLVDNLTLPRVLALYHRIANDVDFMKRTKVEKKFEPNPNIIRVPETFSAVEIVEFCKDEITSSCWNKKLMGGRSMAVTLFWHFVAQKILDINELIGSEYVFLFAADYGLQPFQKGIGKLIRFYRDLHFDYSVDLGTAKPVYDYQCQFLCQRLIATGSQPGLDTYQKEFFDAFNEDPKARDYT